MTGDYHLRFGCPAAGAGLNVAVPTDLAMATRAPPTLYRRV